MRTITVVGIDHRALEARASQALAEATLVIGARCHLSAVTDLLRSPVPTVELGPLGPAIAALAGHQGPAVVLASGDPGWFGIVRALSAAGLGPLRVIPSLSSLTRLAAACGQPWDHVVVCSAHGRDPRPAVNMARALPAVAVLTGPDLTISNLASALDGWARTLTVGERLGWPEERITTCPAATAAGQSWAEPNIVLVTDPSRPLPASSGDSSTSSGGNGKNGSGWALAETAYEHRDGMITKAEVRALVVARLAPATGRMIWDIGAGSGAVGIECSGHGAAVIAVEADPEAGQRILRNAARHNAAVRLVAGRAPEVLAGLPEPDAVFIGGGGPAVVQAIAGPGVRRIVVTCAALDHALAARTILLSAGYAVDGVHLAASRLAELPGGSVRLAPLNPMIVLTASSTGEPL